MKLRAILSVTFDPPTNSRSPAWTAGRGLLKYMMWLGHEDRDVAPHRLITIVAKNTLRCVIKGVNSPLVIDDYDRLNSRIDNLSEPFLALSQSSARFKPLVSEHQTPLYLRVPAFRLHELCYIAVSDKNVTAAGAAGDGHVEPAFLLTGMAGVFLRKAWKCAGDNCFDPLDELPREQVAGATRLEADIDVIPAKICFRIGGAVFDREFPPRRIDIHNVSGRIQYRYFGSNSIEGRRYSFGGN